MPRVRATSADEAAAARMSMLSELIETLSRDDSEGWLRIHEAEWHGADLVLRVELRPAEARADWEIRCDNVLAYTIVDVVGAGINHLTDGSHPVLRQYQTLHGKLFFRGEAEEITQVIGDLWLAHRDECDDWISFDAYLRANDLPDLLADGSGLLAEGPRFLLQAYAATLVQHGIKATLVAERPFRRWDGVEWPPGEAIEALHFGDSYVVAERIAATRVKND